MFKVRSVMRLSSQLRGAQIGFGDILCLLLLLVLPVTCSALEIRSVQICSGIVLRLRGDIKVGDYSRLKARFKGKEAIVGFDLSSEGGDLEEGLRIADLVRRKALTVYVADKCNSACADVFFLLQLIGILERTQRSVSMLFLMTEITKTWGLSF